MRNILTFAALAGLVAGSLPAAAQEAPPPAKRNSCFYSNQFDNWKAADKRTLYIRIRPNRYYRLDLSNDCYAALQPGAFLVTKVEGPSTICSAVDWNLRVANSWNDIPEACIVKSMTELTPAEVAALPKKVKP
jgi:hypothetical protein